jgi:hypothetical protein
MTRRFVLSPTFSSTCLASKPISCGSRRTWASSPVSSPGAVSCARSGSAYCVLANISANLPAILSHSRLNRSGDQMLAQCGPGSRPRRRTRATDAKHANVRALMARPHLKRRPNEVRSSVAPRSRFRSDPISRSGSGHWMDLAILQSFSSPEDLGIPLGHQSTGDP